MKKILLTLLLTATLTGCSTIQGWIPSFWDDNQSARIVDIRQKINNIECAKPHLEQAQGILKDIQWFELYSQSKGIRQNDVVRIVEPMKETAVEWAKRSSTQEGSKVYCELKKKMLVQQSSRAAEAILGRF
jgi:flagellar basal body L-ring protein FlgH